MRKMFDNAQIDALYRMLDESTDIVLTCHVRPDGDAIGSTLGLAAILSHFGKRTHVVVPDTPPRNLNFLPGFADIIIHTRYDPYCTRVVKECDLIVCCDFNTPSRQDMLEPLIQGAGKKMIMIDHHQKPDDFADLVFSYPEMSSTCELVFRLICALGWYSDMDRDCAVALMTGLMTDTRNLSVNCHSTDIFEIVEKLMEKGADRDKIVKLALMTRSLASLKIQAYALSEKLEVFDRHHAAVVTLSQDELKRFHYERGDTEGLVNAPLEVRGMVWSAFLREDSDCVKVSMRSCFDFPVSKVCEDLFSGGGHLQAAGGEFKGSLEDCRKTLVEAMRNYDKNLPKKVERIERFDK